MPCPNCGSNQLWDDNLAWGCNSCDWFTTGEVRNTGSSRDVFGPYVSRAKKHPQADAADIAIKALIAELSATAYTVNDPGMSGSDWWIDLSIEGYRTEVWWSADRGYGIFVTEDSAYTAQPDEFYGDARQAAIRLRQLARTM